MTVTKKKWDVFYLSVLYSSLGHIFVVCVCVFVCVCVCMRVVKWAYFYVFVSALGSYEMGGGGGGGGINNILLSS